MLFKRIAKFIIWLTASVIILAVVAVALLYVPPVQRAVTRVALAQVKKSTGMDIAVENLRLRFPLTLELGGVSVLEATGDTMVTAGSVGVQVRLLPLLRGDIDVASANARSVFYQLGTPDSAMWLRARAEEFRLSAAQLYFGRGVIDIDRATADSITVRLVMKDTVTPAPEQTAAGAPLRITARELALTRVDYAMTMLPVIDSMHVRAAGMHLYGGLVDTGHNRIDADSISADAVSGIYLTPSAEQLAAYPTDSLRADSVAATPDSALWTITARHVGLTATDAVYAMRGAVPQPGLDMNYLEVTDVSIAVDSFYNRGTSMTVPLTELLAHERSGLQLNARGTFSMDSTSMRATGFDISTAFSTLKFDAEMGMGTPLPEPSSPLRLSATGTIAPADVALAYPSLDKTLATLPPGSDLTLRADVRGTSGLVEVRTLRASMPGMLDIEADGNVANPFDPARIDGNVALRGSLTGLNRLKPTLLEAKVAHEVNLPPMRVDGKVTYSPAATNGMLTVTSAGGRISLDADWVARNEGYDLDLAVDSFPVVQFLPNMGLDFITATAHAKGHGLDPMKRTAATDAHVSRDRVRYKGRTYSDVTLDATLSEGNAHAMIVSNNPDAVFNADLDAIIDANGYKWTLDGDIADLDLRAIGISPTSNGGSLSIAGEGSISSDMRDINARINLDNVDWNLDGSSIAIPKLEALLNANDSLVTADLTSGDLSARAIAFCPLDTLMARATAFPAVIDSAVATRNADIRRIQRSLPPLDVRVNAGTDNFLTDYLKASGTEFANARVTLTNDSLIAFNADVLRLRTGSTRLDTISFGAVQHGKFLAFKAALNNRPGTFDQFAHVNLTGFLADDKLALLLRQRDINDRQGFFLGVNLTMQDSLATLRLVPRKPTVGYKEWTLNTDNYISYNFTTHRVAADLTMQSDRSLIKIFTEPSADTLRSQDDVVVRLSDIHLADWLSISPFAPPIKGDLGADMRIHWDADNLTGAGTIGVTDLYYGRDRVGTFDIGVDVTTGRSGALRADASLLVDSIKVITATGSLNDTTAAHPFMLDFSMIHFPLHIANPFLPKDMARLSGTLNGEMDITGSLAEPRFDGYLTFDSSEVRVGMLGQSFRFSDDKIPVDSSVVHFNDFTITAANANPLTLNGTVDMRHLTDISLDLGAKASDMQIVNSNRARGADVYGKAFIDLDAAVKGHLSFLRVNADLSVLPGTNVTYVLSGAESVIASQATGDMVKFVQFSDTAAVQQADSVAMPSMAMMLDATLNVMQGSTINVDISSDGKNRATIQGQGTLDYSQNPMNDGRLTGRFNINSGFVRYTPPMMSEKKFEFEEGSYVSFNGDMLNPILNIHAVDHLKANVTQPGQNSRLIEFDVSLAVTNTLQNMNVAFDLATNDDITVQNELASMSQEQRANQAMNLLLYNTYTGPGTKASSSLSGNPLYSFLASQLNSWAANTIKGVDISFGIDQYNKTTDGYTSSTTSYSYRVSKSLFNDRVKIIVGGNYSTDADADENFEQNLINDIAFEYMLNRSGSMYLRIFRHTGYESILEGEITQTGVGFVLRRKINSLRDLFRWAGRLRDSVVKPKENTDTK